MLSNATNQPRSTVDSGTPRDKLILLTFLEIDVLIENLLYLLNVLHISSNNGKH